MSEDVMLWVCLAVLSFFGWAGWEAVFWVLRHLTVIWS